MTAQFILLDRRGIVVYSSDSFDDVQCKLEQWSTPAMHQGMYYTGPYTLYVRSTPIGQWPLLTPQDDTGNSPYLVNK